MSNRKLIMVILFIGLFSFACEKVIQLNEKLNEYFHEFKREKVSNTYNIDAVLELSGITEKFYNDIARLAPHGVGNPKPVFKFVGVRVVDIKHFGSGKNHLEIIVEQKKVMKKAMVFFKLATDFSKLILGEKCDLVATVEMSYFRGRPELRLRIVDVL